MWRPAIRKSLASAVGSQKYIDAARYGDREEYCYLCGVFSWLSEATKPLNATKGFGEYKNELRSRGTPRNGQRRRQTPSCAKWRDMNHPGTVSPSVGKTLACSQPVPKLVKTRFWEASRTYRVPLAQHWCSQGSGAELWQAVPTRKDWATCAQSAAPSSTARTRRSRSPRALPVPR